MKDSPHSLAGFIRFLNLKSLRARTLESYLSWVKRIAKHLIQSPPPAPSPFRFAPGLLLRRSLSRGCRRRSVVRRWCQHILPKGLMRVRRYGFLSAAAKARLERLRHILGVLTPPLPPKSEPPTIQCACCQKPMRLVGRIEALALWRVMLSQTQPNGGPPAPSS